MTRSARGTIAEPGRNVAAKAGLNRGILANGWGLLITRLEQKAPGRVEKVNPAIHLANLQRLQTHRPRVPQEPSGLRVRGLWASGQRRRERGTQHR